MSATSRASSSERLHDASAAMSSSIQHAANSISGSGGDLLDSEKRALQRAALAEVHFSTLSPHP